MAELIRDLDPEVIRRNLEEVRSEVGDRTQVLAATKYVAPEEIHKLVEAGVTLYGENRAQDLVAKHADHPDLTWDFIGQLQSRKVKQILPLVRYVHSVDSDSVLQQLQTHGTPDTKVLIQVNVAREEGKAGVHPEDLGAFIERGVGGGVNVVGLMTMPPLAEKPQDNARWFAALAELAATHGLHELSMGTTQDYAVAAREGATIVRVGTRLYTPR
jgi:pyridoxal phosphate enzyme (YggS family)